MKKIVSFLLVALFAATAGFADEISIVNNVLGPSADGQRFVVSSNPAEKYSATITVLTNWLNEVKRY